MALMKVLVTSVIFASISTPAYAYLDPGTGSILLQGAIAAIATVGYVLKLYWYRIKAFVLRQPLESLEDLEDDENNSSQ